MCLIPIPGSEPVPVPGFRAASVCGLPHSTAGQDVGGASDRSHTYQRSCFHIYLFLRQVHAFVHPHTVTTHTHPPHPHNIHKLHHLSSLLPPLHRLHSNGSLCGLYKALHSSITEHNRQKPDRPVCLVFNDLSTLISIGVEVKQVISFVRYCCDMVTMPGEQRAVS